MYTYLSSAMVAATLKWETTYLANGATEGTRVLVSRSRTLPFAPSCAGNVIRLLSLPQKKCNCVMEDELEQKWSRVPFKRDTAHLSNLGNLRSIQSF